MAFEVVAAAEVLAAHVTLMWLDPCVCRQMALQVDVLGKVLAAGRAGERSCPLVTPHVNLEGAVAGEGVAAVVTGEGRLRPRVKAHVTQQVGARAVATLARAAGKAALGVRAHVLSQTLFVGEDLEAQLADMAVGPLALTTILVTGVGRGGGEALLQDLPALFEQRLCALVLVLRQALLAAEDLATDQAQRGGGRAVLAV